MSQNPPRENEVASQEHAKKRKEASREKKDRKRKHNLIEDPSRDPAPLKRVKSGNTTQETQRSDVTATSSERVKSSGNPLRESQQSDATTASLNGIKSTRNLSKALQKPHKIALSSSPFRVQTASLYVPIPPIALQYASQGLCAEIISGLILRYYPPLQGIVLAYDRFQLSDEHGVPIEEGSALARSVDEYAACFIWVTADFLMFQPRKGDQVAGCVTIQNEDHLGLLCWNIFNAKILKEHLPGGWKWIAPPARHSKTKGRLKGDGTSTTADAQPMLASIRSITNLSSIYEGHYEDENGARISGCIHFAIEDVEASASMEREKGYVTLEGTMVQDSQAPDQALPEADGPVTRELEKMDEGLQNGTSRKAREKRKKSKKKVSTQ